MSDITHKTMLPQLIWENCYDKSWKGIITPESFAHPAKMARGLLCRILDTMLKQGWISRGQVCCDPFAGIGTTGIECASRGIRFVGCELEERFHKMAMDNFALHEHTWKQFGDPLPRIVCGDSRRLGEVLTEAGALVSSPPYAESIGNENHIDYSRGKTPGGGKKTSIAREAIGGAYGETAGQLGALPAGSVEAVVSSPPWENQEPSHAQGSKFEEVHHILYPTKRPKDRPGLFSHEYGSTHGNIGNAQGDTFWSAARIIILQCHAVLRPSAMTCWVTKDFVRDGQRVSFSADWLRLLQSCGFEPVLWVKASLVKEDRHAGLFGGDVVKIKKKVSFFRRLHESRMAEDDPRRIDNEDVLFCRRG